jgi:hypothetical protein
VTLYAPRYLAVLNAGLYAALAIAGGVAATVGGIGLFGWALAAFFAACTALGVKAIFRRDSLSLTSEGFAVSIAGTRQDYRWSQVHGFYRLDRKPWLGAPRSVIGVDFVEGEAGVFDQRFVGFAERVTTQPGTSSRVVRGRAGSLPSTYGLQADDLVNLLEGWRRKSP